MVNFNYQHYNYYNPNEESSHHDFVCKEVTNSPFAGHHLLVFPNNWKKTLPSNGIKEKDLQWMEQFYYAIVTGQHPVIKIVSPENLEAYKSQFTEFSSKRIRKIENNTSLDNKELKRLRKDLAEVTKIESKELIGFKEKVCEAMISILIDSRGRELLQKITSHDRCHKEIIISLWPDDTKVTRLFNKAFIFISKDDERTLFFESKPTGEIGVRTSRMSTSLYHELVHCLRSSKDVWDTMSPVITPDMDDLEEGAAIMGWLFDPRNRSFANLGSKDDVPSERLTTLEKTLLLNEYITSYKDKLKLTDKDINKLKKDMYQSDFDMHSFFKTLCIPYHERAFETGLKEGRLFYPRADHIGIAPPKSSRDLKGSSYEMELKDYIYKLIRYKANVEELEKIDYEGFDWNTLIDNEKNTALMLAIIYENSEAIEFLLNKLSDSLDFSSKNEFGDNILTYYAKKMIKISSELVFSKVEKPELIKRLDILTAVVKKLFQLGAKADSEVKLIGIFNAMSIFLVQAKDLKTEANIRSCLKQLIESLTTSERNMVLNEAINNIKKGQYDPIKVDRVLSLLESLKIA